VDAGRSRLIRLNNSEIEELLHALPPLSVWWARQAQVPKSALDKRQPNAVRAVRAKLARNAEGFHHGLAWSAIETFVGKLDSDEDRVGQANHHGAALLAARAGAALGPDLGIFIVHAVAESNLPMAEIAREHLEQLIQTIHQEEPVESDNYESDSEVTVKLSDESMPAPAPNRVAPVVIKRPPAANRQELPSNAPDDSREDLLVATVAVDSETLYEKLSRVLDLLKEGPSIADDLRDLASEIEVGGVPIQGPENILAGATMWLDRASILVEHEETLLDTSVRIRADIQARLERLSELKDLARAIEYLQSAGLVKQAVDLLQHNDFESLDFLSRAIAALDLEGEGPESAGNRGSAPVDDDLLHTVSLPSPDTDLSVIRAPEAEIEDADSDLSTEPEPASRKSPDMAPGIDGPFDTPLADASIPGPDDELASCSGARAGRKAKTTTAATATIAAATQRARCIPSTNSVLAINTTVRAAAAGRSAATCRAPPMES